MSKKIILNIAAFVITALVCAAITLAAFLFTNILTEKLTPYTETGTDGNEIAVYRIEDLPEVNEVRYTNYSAGKFLSPQSEISGKITDLNAHPYFEGRGTLQFVFMGLDPDDESYAEKIEALEPYLRGDNAWHFTLYLPAMTGAVNIYVRAEYTSSAGQISDYDFTDYSDYVGYSQKHVSESEPFYIDLVFKSQEALNEELAVQSTTVTVHFEASEGRSANFTGLPVAGERDDVVFAVSEDRTALIIASVVASLIVAAFLFAAVLKRTLKFLPPTFAAAGILGFTFFTQVMYSRCAFPYMAGMFTGVFAALIPLSAICGMREKIKKFPLWIAFAVFAAAACVIAGLAQPVTDGVFGLLNVIFGTITALMTVILAAIKALRTRTKSELIIPLFCVAFTLTHIFAQERAFILTTPQIWMCAAILLVTVVLGVMLFANIERRNRMLTYNLKSEVERQTSELRDMIDDRDKLLRYLSHDLKKPAVRIKQMLGYLKTVERDKEKLKLITAAENKIQSIDENLAELQRYAKHNYSAEIPEEINAGEIIDYVYTSFGPDCEAQGVHLYTEETDIRAFAKRNMLVSVLTNLIFNALEHAQCSYIKIYADSTAKCCRFYVTDDGKGIEREEEAFRPYYSEADSRENLGLGLYLCRQLMQAMGGNLVYERQGKKTVFIASVPLLYGKDIC